MKYLADNQHKFHEGAHGNCAHHHIFLLEFLKKLKVRLSRAFLKRNQMFNNSL